MGQLVCPACGAVNRLPDHRDPTAARCGTCHQPFFAGRPVEVTGAELDAHLASTKGAAVLLDVWAPWCGPCRAMAPQFAAAANALEPDVRLLKLNSEASPQAAQSLGVSGIPALFLFREGKVLGRQAGLMNTDQIVAWTRQTLAQAAPAARQGGRS